MRPRIYSCILIIFSLFLITSCATGPKLIKDLESPSHSNEMYAAMVFGRIRIHSPVTPLFTPIATSTTLKMAIFRIDAEPAPNRLINLNWEIKKSTSYTELENSFFLEAVPGTYNLQWIGVGYSSTSISKFMFPTNPEKNPKGPYADPKRLFTVKPNSLTYLGIIDITISSYTDSQTRYLYEYKIRYDNNLIEDVELLKRNHPVLYEKYKGNITQAF